MTKSPSVQIPDEAYSAFKKLIEFGSERIRQLTEALLETGPTLDSVSFRSLSASKKMGDIDLAEDVETILRDVVFPIRRTMYRHGVSASDMVSGLSGAITRISSLGEQTDGFSKKEALQWAECEAAISDLLDSDTMKIEGKAEALIDARGNRIFGINLYSELRPIFDEHAEQVKANVLTNTLVIRFNGGGRPRTESFALDPASLKELKDQVDRALRKNATLVKGEGQNARLLVVRSDSDPSGEIQ
jgi:hypothetical protein